MDELARILVRLKKLPLELRESSLAFGDLQLLTGVSAHFCHPAPQQARFPLPPTHRLFRRSKKMDHLLPLLLAFPPVAPSPPEDYERQIKSLQHVLNTTSGHVFLEKVDEEHDLLDVRRPLLFTAF
jgi:hypothetical protein